MSVKQILPELHSYIVKVGYTGVLFLIRNIVCGYSLEPPPVYQQSKFDQQYRSIKYKLLLE